MNVDPATTPPLASAAHRAAFLARVLGVIEIAVFGFIASGLWMASRLDPAQLEQRVVAGEISADQAAQVQDLQPQARTMAIATVVFGIAPGAAYLVLSLAIRRARRPATLGALVLAVVQLLAVGLWSIDILATAVRAGNPVTVTLLVLSVGTFVGLLVGVILWCRRSLTAR